MTRTPWKSPAAEFRTTRNASIARTCVTGAVIAFAVIFPAAPCGNLIYLFALLSLSFLMGSGAQRAATAHQHLRTLRLMRQAARNPSPDPW